jgi:hypothetical protein
MNMPVFNAEAALYSRSTYYRPKSNAVSASDNKTNVVPQACPWWMWIGCKASVMTCNRICALVPFSELTPCVDLCLAMSGAEGCGECA